MFFTDRIPPEIRCPNHIVVAADKGKNTVTVGWEIPHATDNSGFAPKLKTEPPNIIPPRTFTIGDHHLLYIAIDHSGLNSSCTMYIRVLGNAVFRI